MIPLRFQFLMHLNFVKKSKNQGTFPIGRSLTIKLLKMVNFMFKFPFIGKILLLIVHLFFAFIIKGLSQ